MQTGDDFNPYAMPEESPEPRSKRERLSTAHDFRISEVLSRSWQILRSRLWAVVGAMLMSSFLGGLLGGIGSSMQPEGEGAKPNGPGVLLILIGVLVNLYMHCGFLNFLVNLASGRRALVSDVFRVGNVFPKAILAVILYSLVFFGMGIAGLVLVGVVAQGAPALAVVMVPLLTITVFTYGIRLSQFFYLLVDRDVSAAESLKLSWKIMEGRIVQFMTLIMALWLVNLCGLLAMGVGLFITVPLTYVSTAVYYLGVTGQPVADPYALAETAEDSFV